MRILRLAIAIAVLSFLAVQLSPGARAAGQVSEVLIGELLPLTGNFASLGQQYLWAGQTVEDIVNNDYPDLQVPLGPGKGFPGLGGAKMTLVVREEQERRHALMGSRWRPFRPDDEPRSYPDTVFTGF